MSSLQTVYSVCFTDKLQTEWTPRARIRFRGRQQRATSPPQNEIHARGDVLYRAAVVAEWQRKQLSTKFRKLKLSKIETAGPPKIGPRGLLGASAELRNDRITCTRTLIFAQDRRRVETLPILPGSVQLPGMQTRLRGVPNS